MKINNVLFLFVISFGNMQMYDLAIGLVNLLVQQLLLTGNYPQIYKFHMIDQLERNIQLKWQMKFRTVLRPIINTLKKF